MCRCIKDIGTFSTNFNFFSKRIELSLSFHFFPTLIKKLIASLLQFSYIHLIVDDERQPFIPHIKHAHF
jgi:hypothetical protein